MSLCCLYFISIMSDWYMFPGNDGNYVWMDVNDSRVGPLTCILRSGSNGPPHMSQLNWTRNLYKYSSIASSKTIRRVINFVFVYYHYFNLLFTLDIFDIGILMCITGWLLILMNEWSINVKLHSTVIKLHNSVLFPIISPDGKWTLMNEPRSPRS